MIGINSCHRAGLLYTGQVRLNWRFSWLAIPVALALLGAGCSGINTSQSVSPASFFLPGLMRNDAPAQTNAPVALPETAAEFVLAE